MFIISSYTYLKASCNHTYENTLYVLYCIAILTEMMEQLIFVIIFEEPENIEVWFIFSVEGRNLSESGTRWLLKAKYTRTEYGR